MRRESAHNMHISREQSPSARVHSKSRLLKTAHRAKRSAKAIRILSSPQRQQHMSSQVLDRMNRAQASKQQTTTRHHQHNHHRACRSQRDHPPASKRVHSSQRMLQGRTNEIDATPHITISKHACHGKPSRRAPTNAHLDDTIRSIALASSTATVSSSRRAHPHRSKLMLIASHRMTAWSRMDRTHPSHSSLRNTSTYLI